MAFEVIGLQSKGWLQSSWAEPGHTHLPHLPRPPNVPLLRAWWSLLHGIGGFLKGSWAVLVRPPKLTCNLQRGPFKRPVVYEGPPLRFHVCRCQVDMNPAKPAKNHKPFANLLHWGWYGPLNGLPKHLSINPAIKSTRGRQRITILNPYSVYLDPKKYTE